MQDFDVYTLKTLATMREEKKTIRMLRGEKQNSII